MRLPGQSAHRHQRCALLLHRQQKDLNEAEIILLMLLYAHPIAHTWTFLRKGVLVQVASGELCPESAQFIREQELIAVHCCHTRRDVIRITLQLELVFKPATPSQPGKANVAM